MQNIEEIRQKTTKPNEELKITIKMLQQEQLIYSNLIKKLNTFKCRRDFRIITEHFDLRTFQFHVYGYNYKQAVNLLKEHFGEPKKIISVHMQALLDRLNPVYQLSSLQLFYDTMENHVRGLESLGRSHETYGDLLVPIVLGKLPSDMRTNLACDLDSPEWTFQQL